MIRLYHRIRLFSMIICDFLKLFRHLSGVTAAFSERLFPWLLGNRLRSLYILCRLSAALLLGPLSPCPERTCLSPPFYIFVLKRFRPGGAVIMILGQEVGRRCRRLYIFALPWPRGFSCAGALVLFRCQEYGYVLEVVQASRKIGLILDRPLVVFHYLPEHRRRFFLVLQVQHLGNQLF